MRYTIHLLKLNKISNKFFSTLLLFHLCFFSVSAQTPDDSSTVRKQIRLSNQQMEAAFNNNDMNKVAAFYAADGEIVNDRYTVKGRSNLDKYWDALKNKGRAGN